jgi:hypothetical protein
MELASIVTGVVIVGVTILFVLGYLMDRSVD